MGSAQSIKPSTIEFTDISIKATLPLHPYLAAHPRLSVAVIDDGNVYAETPVVNGDMEAGIWKINSSLCANPVKQSVTLAIVVSRGSLSIRFASVKLSVAELLTRIEARPDGYQEFRIGDSDSSIQLVISCSVKASPLSILNNRSSQLGAHDNFTVGKVMKNPQSHYEQKKSELPSRVKLESAYVNVIRMPDQDKKAHVLSLLGRAYHAYYQETRAKADLEKAISMHEEAMQFTGPSRSQLAKHAHDFAAALVERSEQSGDPVDLERAISHYQTALEATDSLDVVRAGRLSSLGNALQLRFQHLGDLSDLERAVLVKQEAVELTPDGHLNKPGRLSNLGNALELRFKRLGSIADLEDAISKKRKAVELTPNGHPNKAALLNNLGGALQSQFERLGTLADLEDAISKVQEAVELIPNDHPDKPRWLNNLGSVLQSRFERLDSVADLEDAISNKRKAVELMPDGHPDRVSLLNNLGSALQSHFECLGTIADLEDAISNERKAVELTPNDHPDKPRRINNLGNALQSRFERLGILTDAEDALSSMRKAVELTPNGHPDEIVCLNNLGGALRSRFERLGNVADLEDAISNERKAVELTSNDHPDKPKWLNNLGSALQSRFERLGCVTDLEDAISSLGKAVQLTPDGHPYGPRLFKNLGNVFSTRFRVLGVLGDLESALSAFSTAANSTSGPAMIRFKAARRWAKVAEEHSRSPLEAFGCAIGLLPQIAWLGLAVIDQHALLADVGGIVRDAVAAAIKYEEYETAVVWAEQGRSIVWQNLLGLRNPVNDLREEYPELANRLQRIAGQLEGSVPHEPIGDNKQKAPAEDVSHAYLKLALEWDSLVEEIRSLPTFEGFLKAKAFRQLAPAAHEGPVVILNVNDVRCDALVLLADESTQRHVSAFSIPLERFSHEKSKNMLKTLTALLSSAGVRERNDRKTGRAQSPDDTDVKFKVILRVLWQDVVKPVIEGLAFQTESKRPRIWWCATGVLAFLPIHAAGLYDTEEVGEKVSDYVVSSYTSTLNAILRLPDPVVREDFQVLTVAQASAPGAPPIPKTEDEVKIVRSLVASARVLNLTKEKATVERVREGMMESNWIHLACHGKQNSENPMESGFLLHDRMLKLSEIVKMSLPKADFAFLSACQTAMGDEKVAEESVHLAAGMFLSGCRGVIATTWSIRDDDAPKIAQEVYSRMFKDGKPNRKEAAYALHEAVKLLRESGAPCTSWVPFIHIGR